MLPLHGIRPLRCYSVHHRRFVDVACADGQTHLPYATAGPHVHGGLCLNRNRTPLGKWTATLDQITFHNPSRSSPQQEPSLVLLLVLLLRESPQPTGHSPPPHVSFPHLSHGDHDRSSISTSAKMSTGPKRIIPPTHPWKWPTPSPHHHLHRHCPVKTMLMRGGQRKRRKRRKRHQTPSWSTRSPWRMSRQSRSTFRAGPLTFKMPCQLSSLMVGRRWRTSWPRPSG